MSNTGKFFIVTAIACAVLLIGGVAFLRSPRPAVAPKSAAEISPQIPAASAQAAIVRQSAAAPAQAAPVETTLVAESLPPLSPKATSVPDKYLLNLSSTVDLPHAGLRPPDKARWAQSIRVAEQLLQGPCDCEQRNWLNHFVAAGNLALTGSVEDYQKELALLVTLARNDSQPIASNSR
ncbi:MAG: hypothetical protein H0X40_08400 [Chthoniobacterales bacterium]|nr:hypothetical protein [Chthoniobacterales bacterium]